MSVAQALREPEVFTQGNEGLVYEDGLAGMSNPKLVARGAEAALAAERARKLEAAAAAPLSAVGVSATAATPVAAEGAAANDDAVASMAAKTVCSGVVYHFDREERRRAGKMRIEQLRAEVGAEPLQGFEVRPAFRFAKRSFDIVFSAAALVCFCWLFAIVAVLVKLDDPKGPVFFKQQRVGKNGKPFTMLKFRTMCVDAEDRLVSLMELNEKTGPVFKIAKDPRITPVGKWLRKLSLDELPQFINVLLGHMSVVGPRPALPNEVAAYNDYQKQRLLVKPGLTCYWQTRRNRDSITFDEWVALDLLYVKKSSPWTDSKILAHTTYPIVKRIFDILFSAAVCLVFAIPVLLACVCIVLESPGKPFFSQERIGKDGKRVRILKLRTMVNDAHSNPRKYMSEEQFAVWKREQKLEDDPRVTKIGKFLRKTSLDELPQFLNVLVGDLSVIGPRPVTLGETYEYGFARRDILSVKPGITGLWQCTERNDATWENGRRQELELEYVSNQSLAMDTRCFCGTFGVMFGKNKTGR